jgi:hypothetical protein
MAFDDFNRADAGTLGANWTDLQGSIDIVSNQAKTTAAGLERAYYTAASAPDNQYSQVVAAGVGTNGFQGPMVRASDVFVLNTSGNAYFLVWSSSGAAQGLYKLANGVTSLLQSITGSLSANDLLKIVANSNVIQCFKNGTQLGTDQTDGSLSSGSPGIYNTQNASLQVIFDDWQGGSVGMTAHPISDVSAGSWTASTGSDLYAMIDEETASDSDYDRSGASPSDDTMEVRLTALGIPDAGDVTFTIRHRTA